MHFTKTLDGHTCKNPMARDGDTLLIRMDNTYPHPPVIAKARYVDLPLLAPHRFRFINGRVITTVKEGTLEVTMPIESILLRKSRAVLVTHKDGDALNVHLDNLEKPATPRTSTDANGPRTIYATDGEYALIHLVSGDTLRIDRNNLQKIKNYPWHLDPDGIVRARFRNIMDLQVVLVLYRLLLDVPKRSQVTAIFKDGDHTNYTVANLDVVQPDSVKNRVTKRRENAANKKNAAESK